MSHTLSARTVRSRPLPPVAAAAAVARGAGEVAMAVATGAVMAEETFAQERMQTT